MIPLLEKARQMELTASEQLLLDYIIEDPKRCIHQNLKEICEQLYISNATIVRFCQKIGFCGFNEFKFELRSQLESHRENLLPAPTWKRPGPTHGGLLPDPSGSCSSLFGPLRSGPRSFPGSYPSPVPSIAQPARSTQQTLRGAGRICWYSGNYRAALMAAMAPSDTAVATWRTCLTRMSPAAYTPGMEVSIFSLVTI